MKQTKIEKLKLELEHEIDIKMVQFKKLGSEAKRLDTELRNKHLEMANFFKDELESVQWLVEKQFPEIGLLLEELEILRFHQDKK